MIVPRLELQQILNGEVGEAVTKCGPPVGAEVWVRQSRWSEPACRARVVDVWPHGDGFSVLLERVADGVPARPVCEKPSLALTRAQRAKLFVGELPHIGGRGKPPVEAGQMVRLSALVTLTVLRVDVKAGKWKLHYELKDTRDPVRLLRRTPPAHSEGDEFDITDPDAIKEAAVQSFYTSRPGAAVAEAGEAPDREWVAARTKTQREFDSQRRLARHAEKLRDKSKQKTRRKKAA